MLCHCLHGPTNATIHGIANTPCITNSCTPATAPTAVNTAASRSTSVHDAE